MHICLNRIGSFRVRTGVSESGSIIRHLPKIPSCSTAAECEELMYKVAILGCENSHANTFLNLVLNKKIVEDIEFIGVYSDDAEAAEKLHAQFGVPVTASYDAFVGQVDGIMITARHGDNHYKYAKPYIESGIPMFIDKPITCSEEEALRFMEELKQHHVPACGGSICVFDKHVQKLKKAVQAEEYGKVLGGFLRAPINMSNPYGDFYFYSQHLAQVMQEIFGHYPNKVRAVEKDGTYNCLVRYDDYDVNLCYVDHNGYYYAGINCADNYVGDRYTLEGCSEQEILEFAGLLKGQKQRETYEELFAPVYVINALKRAFESGREEKVQWPEGFC